MMVNLLLLLVIPASIDCYIIDPGPLIKATKGEVWPKPQIQKKSQDFFIVRPNLFNFKSENQECPHFLQQAFSRYLAIIKNQVNPETSHFKTVKFWAGDEHFLGYLVSLNVQIIGSCAEGLFPTIDSNEEYSLSITTQENNLTAPSIWGILRGLETFSQLLYLEHNWLAVNASKIVDYPRYPHRGLLLDTSRHFIPVYLILSTLDAMSYNKLNVFHWHITDDQSFPYKSSRFPELSEKGAYHPSLKVYDQLSVRRIIEYARLRGIRVLSEFDTPGHTRSWGVAHPELLTPCYINGQKSGKLGPMNPIHNSTYTFLEQFFEEVMRVFPDYYLHLGGDEVGFECWQSNPEITSFMQKNALKDYVELENFFIQNLLGIVNKLGGKYLVWEEVFVNGVDIPNSTIVHIWRSNGLNTLRNVLRAGKLALYSSCWYLDHLASGGDWVKFYRCEIEDFHSTDSQKQRILGGEACMWSEVVNEYNLESRVWPRASATAERLWSAKNIYNLSDANQRLEEHTCRMNRRGIGAQPPNGPGVCL